MAQPEQDGVNARMVIVMVVMAIVVLLGLGLFFVSGRSVQSPPSAGPAITAENE